MRELIVNLLTLSALAGSLAGCASTPGGSAHEDSPPSRIGGFLREMVGYLGRDDLVEVGDLAPDFALMPLRFYDFHLGDADLESNVRADPYQAVRLSAFAGKRPVALVFGSYT